MEEKNKQKVFYILKIIIPLLIAILSFAVFSNYAASDKIHNDTIATLQAKQDKVLQLSAASTAIAAGASLVLGDRAVAVSNKLLDLTGYFIIILSAILLEKYLVTVMGLVSFKIIIPIACIIFSIFTIIDREGMRKLAVKLVTFALVAFMVIPFSVVISNVIESTYGNTINKTIEAGESLKEELEVFSDNATADVNSGSAISNYEERETVEDSSNENGNVIDNIGKILSGAKDKAASAFGNVVKTVTGKAKEWIDKLTTQLNNMIDAIAVMIVTTCVIPILVIVFLIWIVKMLFSVNINIDTKKIPKLSEIRK